MIKQITVIGVFRYVESQFGPNFEVNPVPLWVFAAHLLKCETTVVQSAFLQYFPLVLTRTANHCSYMPHLLFNQPVRLDLLQLQEKLKSSAARTKL